jgi:hypothetical protein
VTAGHGSRSGAGSALPGVSHPGRTGRLAYTGESQRPDRVCSPCAPPAGFVMPTENETLAAPPTRLRRRAFRMRSGGQSWIDAAVHSPCPGSRSAYGTAARTATSLPDGLGVSCGPPMANPWHARHAVLPAADAPTEWQPMGPLVGSEQSSGVQGQVVGGQYLHAQHFGMRLLRRQHTCRCGIPG